MSDLPFVKMEGAGNDFIVLDGRDLSAEPSPDLCRVWCDRRRGIGADGILVVHPVDPGSIDLLYLNADGSEAFCGNGTRCAARYAVDRKLARSPLTIRTPLGAFRASVDEGAVEVEMPSPGGEIREISLGDVSPGLRGSFLTVGVPHVVIEVPDVTAVDLASLGPRVRAHPALGTAGANVNVVARSGRGVIRLRTFERGVEAETLACGTGAAAAAVWDASGQGPVRASVRVASGEVLEVREEEGALWLRGPAREVFRGNIAR